MPLVENGRISVDDPLANIAVSEYVSGLAEAKPSAVIMGCTHYPLLSAVLEKYLPESTLVNCSAETVNEILSENAVSSGERSFYVSDDPMQFASTAKLFLEHDITDRIEKTDIDRA